MSAFIDLELAIVARLETKLASLSPKPRIYSGADLENIKDRSHGDASVFVAYNGITSVEPLQGAPSIATITTEYLIWIVTRSASRHASGQGVREGADDIVVAVIDALMGWRKNSETPALGMTTAPAQVYTNGFGWFPLAFQCRRQARGNPN